MYNIIFDAKATQNLLLDGVNAGEGLVKSTLGPAGRPVIMQGGRGIKTIITKDGVSVANAIDQYDPKLQLGATLLMEAASNANARGGDGTTTCTVLAASIIRALFEYNEFERLGVVNEIRNWLPRIRPYYTETLALPCTELGMLKAVTCISANNDTALGEIIAGAIHESKGLAKITVVNSGELTDTINRVEEAQFISTFTGLDTTKEFNRVQIGIVAGEATVSYLTTLLAGQKRGYKAETPIVLLCEKIESGNTRNIKRLATADIYIGTLPGTAVVRQTHANDIANVLGMNVPDAPVKFVEIDYATIDGLVMLAPKRMRLTLPAGALSKATVLVSELEELSRSVDCTGRTKNLTAARLDIWSPNYYELNIAAISDFERKERFDRAEDCINASRNAYNHGVLGGGGTAGLYLIEQSKTMGLSESAMTAITKMLEAPFRCINTNRALPTGDIDRLIKQFKDDSTDDLHLSYDLFAGSFLPCTDQLILDPVEVFASALDSAISLGLTVATVGGGLIVDHRYFESNEE